MKRSPPAYAAHTQPGLEPIAADEITHRLEDAHVRGTRRVGDKGGLVIFDYDGDVRDLLALRTVEDLFFVLRVVDDLPPVRSALPMLEAAAGRAGTMAQGLALVRQLHPDRGRRGKMPFRVIARQAGRTAFRREEAQRAVERGIAGRTDHRWQPAAENGAEFWLTLTPGEAILALRLTDERMRHRDYKIEHLPASLRPSVAAALVWLTRPAPDDLFLDPMCGAGTILIERAHAGRYRRIVGGDVRAEAVAAARGNIGAKYQPISVEQWDATHLPLEDATVTAAAVNLPFGRQLGSTAENRTLYPAFLREAARVLRHGGRLALLTGDVAALSDALRQSPNLATETSYRVMVLGQPAQIVVTVRR